jgi:aquaporin Z
MLMEANAIVQEQKQVALSMVDSLRKHWPEYLMEAAELGLFMISACVVTTVLEHPVSPINQLIPDPFLRRMLIGIAMGLTAIGIIYSPIGKQSGAHFNPSVTLTFFRLGKVKSWDAFFYIIVQFAGGLAGVLIAALIIGDEISHHSVNHVATVPGMNGPLAAFLAEVVISFVLMSVILTVSNTKNIARFTGLFAGVLVATYNAIEAPISGMSMNPARTFASALPSQVWTHIWIYFTAPVIGMLLAAEVYLRIKGAGSIQCAKLHHQNDKRCIHCGYPGAVKVRN